MKYKITPIVEQPRDSEEFGVGYEVYQFNEKDNSWDYLAFTETQEKAVRFVEACKALPPEEFFE
jgi:hypothetical protein